MKLNSLHIHSSGHGFQSIYNLKKDYKKLNKQLLKSVRLSKNQYKYYCKLGSDYKQYKYLLYTTNRKKGKAETVSNS